MTPPKTPAKKQPATGGTRTVTLNQVTDRAGQLAAGGKLADALVLLEKAAEKFKGANGEQFSVPQLIGQAAAQMRMHHPAAAATLAKEAVQRDPEMMSGWAMLSGLWDRLGELKDAKEACLKVVGSDKSTPQQVLAAANLLVRYKEDKVAIESAAKAFEELGRPLGWASALMYIAQKVADWPLVAQLAQQLREAHQSGNSKEARESPRTNLLWCEDEAMNIAVVKEWSEQSMPGPVGTPPVPTSLEGRRLRVGYLSSDFRDHPTSRLINGMFRNHDREKHELFMYCSGWDDGTPMRKEVVSHFDQVHTVTSLSDEEAAKLIRSHGIDVLVELNGPTRANRMGILKHRPAPVQIDYLGWPGSVGGRVVDYVIGDSYCVPPGLEKMYPEKVIRLHKTYQINDYAARDMPPAPTREKLGLPAGKKVIGMFNAINKVHGDVWAVWMKILQEVPDAVLWILDPGPVARRNIGKACKQHGVDPKRVIAAPPAKQDAHLARLQCCDLMVDPWPYGGHTSTSDSLFAGVPVIAVAGTNFASRVSGGLLRAAGLEALVQPTLEGYVKMAVKLLRNEKELARIKQFISTNIAKSDIFDAKSKTRQFERAYRDAYVRCLEGKPPRHISFGVSAPASQKADSAATKDKVPLVLVCGPWSSGTSAVAGLLAKAGLQAPGPYVAVNDPKTPATYEMKAFQQVLRGLASEETLKRTASSADIVRALQQFRDTALRDAPGPIMLKHALTAVMLPELAQVFDVRVVAVVRPLDAIESTRVRRRWKPSMGAAGAKVVYKQVFEYIANSETPFTVVRYSELLSNPEAALDGLARFCGLAMSDKNRADALAFVSRPRTATRQSAAAQA
ncbi:MAG TPA: hypothetical protein VK996_05330 [Ramlibacter sp.]|nr:hypothetical protein [Ramlibacter sp.]